MTSYDIILSAMINDKYKKSWTAKDFQSGEYFVGYEATARMSELKNKYPDLFIVGRGGRFRTLSINWDYEDIDIFIKEYQK